jgi:hypothetical protein
MRPVDLSPMGARGAETGTMTGGVWRLLHGDKLIAELIVTGGDFPWLNARLRAMTGFEEIRPLFDEDIRLLEHVDDNIGAWETAYHNIRRAVTLLDPGGRAVPEFLLHIDGHDAWWRWSDEPFADDSAKS